MDITTKDTVSTMTRSALTIMKAAALLVTGLVAVAVHAGVLPRDAPAADDGLTKSQDLDDLIEKAKAQITDEVNANEAAVRKRGETPRCTPAAPSATSSSAGSSK